MFCDSVGKKGPHQVRHFPSLQRGNVLHVRLRKNRTIKHSPGSTEAKVKHHGIWEVREKFGKRQSESLLPFIYQRATHSWMQSRGKPGLKQKRSTAESTSHPEAYFLPCPSPIFQKGKPNNPKHTNQVRLQKSQPTETIKKK